MKRITILMCLFFLMGGSVYSRESHQGLLVGIPRELNASYHQFFDYLREVLIEMFEGFHYEYILMPLRISNHDKIQKIFNQYKKKLSKEEKFIAPSVNHFESIGGRNTYYVLHRRTQG